MTNITRVSKAATTDGAGAATVYTDAVNGLLASIQYVKTDYADGVDFTITEEDTGAALWSGTDVNAATTVAPRMATHSTAGAAALYAAGGTAVNDMIPVAGRIKIVIAQGGATKTGQFVFKII